MKTNVVSFSKTRVAGFAKKIWVALPFAAFALSACVTINIYFPAAAAEKAADRIIEEVWQIDKANKPAASGAKTTEPAAKETK